MLKSQSFYKSKKVLVRVDYNVPIKDGLIEDNNRILQSLETINYLLESNAKVILMSHLGKIKSEEDKKSNSLFIVSQELEKLINKKVLFSKDTTGSYLENKIRELKEGEILLIENTRFEDYPDNKESSCNEKLSAYWASLIDEYVFDAFGSVHREHASTYGISTIKGGCTGFLVDKEIESLNEVLKNNNKVIILGGSKVDDKLGVIESLISKSRIILLGGGMCFTFLKSLKYNIGNSLCNDKFLEKSKDLIDLCENKLKLPLDIKIQDNIRLVNEIKDNEIGYDIGPKTIDYYKSLINEGDLVLWNGPLGKFEDEEYENGTKHLMEYLSINNIKTIICGGDTASASKKFNLNFHYISTGGGAALEYLEGKKFKILEVLNK